MLPFTSTYYISVLVVTLGGSTQFYSYGIINVGQGIITEWINQTYTERNGEPLNQTKLNVIWRFELHTLTFKMTQISLF